MIRALAVVVRSLNSATENSNLDRKIKKDGHGRLFLFRLIRLVDLAHILISRAVLPVHRNHPVRSYEKLL